MGKTKGSDIRKVIEKEEVKAYKERIESLVQFKSGLQRIVKKYIQQRRMRLFVFIDDLDRCHPEAAVKAMESVKVFLNLPETVFIIGVDYALIEQGVQIRYKELINIAGDEPITKKFLDKIIQIPYKLLPPSSEDLEEYIKSNWPGNFDLTKKCIKTIKAGTTDNPRTIKRILNVLFLTHSLYQASLQNGDKGNGSVGIDIFLQMVKLATIQVCWPSHYEALSRNTEVLLDDRSLEELNREYPPHLSNLIKSRDVSFPKVVLEKILKVSRHVF